MPNRANRKKKVKRDGPVEKNNKSGSSKEMEKESTEELKKERENISLLGHYITKEYELLRLVLSYLPLRDLYAAEQVCKTWRSTVEAIKRTRQARPHWLFWHCQQMEIGKEVLPSHMFSHHFFSEPQLCLMFMRQALNTAEINCRRSKAPCPCSKEGKHCNMKHRVLHYMRAELRNCPCIMVEGYGVVGSSHDLSFTLEEEDINAYSGVLLPKAPNVSIKVFHLTKKDCNFIKHLNNLGNKEIESLTNLPSSGEPIQCLLLFCKDNYSEIVERLVVALERRQGSKFPLGGGFYDRINLGSLVPMYEKRQVCVVGIAFSGDGVRAASTVLGTDVAGAEQVNEVMEELHSCQLPGQDSIAFMFACCGRGAEWYMADNVESTCFRHYFPTTPLIGYFGSGEIGHKFLPGFKKVLSHQDSKESYKDQCNIIRSYTSVIVLLSFLGQTTT